MIAGLWRMLPDEFSRRLTVLHQKSRASRRNNVSFRAAARSSGISFNGEACEWGHLLGSAKTRWTASRFCRRTAALSSAEGCVRAQEVSARTYCSCSRPRNNQRRPPSIALPTNTPLRMSWTARGRCGRLSLCEIAARPFWCWKIPAASCSAGSSARRWRWDVSCASPSALPRSLGKMHQHGLIHKDIKPANILVNNANGEVRLTGFGLTSRLPRERQAPSPPEFIAGTLAYMAPEQTGRMNRSIDSRSDLYSLGVTLLPDADRCAALHRARPAGMGPLPHRQNADAAAPAAWNASRRRFPGLS